MPTTTTNTEGPAQTLAALVNDPSAVLRLAGFGMTDEELGDYFSVDAKELRARLDAPLRKARADLKLRVRTAILSRGEIGHTESLAWLQQQYL